MSRFLIAAAHKSSGKTVVSTGLAAALHAKGRKVQTFKKGPDYIDPMWLAAASHRPCYNLDFNTMSPDELRAFFAAQEIFDGISLIETNKGLFDGVDLDGRDSNAALAKLLQVPVVLVVDTGGMTRGIAPLLQGYRAFDADVNIAGVILNKVGGARHESKLRAAVETYTDIPVLGAVGRNPALAIGERHLGLTTPAESTALTDMIATFGDIMAQSVDIDRLEVIAERANLLNKQTQRPAKSTGRTLRIGIAQDTAFGFYYADDLEAFSQFGAELVPINTLKDRKLPDIDGLFFGGGFPETQMDALSANTALMTDIRQQIKNGLPGYAECGGLMYLCESLSWNGARQDMVGIIPGDAVMHEKPQGRGYANFTVTLDHPWARAGQLIKAHEFHYASIENLPDGMTYGREIKRGMGIDGKKDAIVIHNLVAGFCHLRSSAVNPWVRDFVSFVRRKAE